MKLIQPVRPRDAGQLQWFRRSGACRVLEQGWVDAATAHTVQPKDLGLPRGLPAASEAVPGGVWPVVGGASQSSRRRSHDEAAVVETRGATQQPALHGASGPGRLVGSRPSVHGSARRHDGRSLKRKGGPRYGHAGGGHRVRAASAPVIRGPASCRRSVLARFRRTLEWPASGDELTFHAQNRNPGKRTTP